MTALGQIISRRLPLTDYNLRMLRDACFAVEYATGNNGRVSFIITVDETPVLASVRSYADVASAKCAGEQALAIFRTHLMQGRYAA